MGFYLRILGELEVLRDGDTIELGSPRQRALLARLAIEEGRVVSTDRLVEDLWAGTPPKSARHTLHVYVSRLRKALGPDGDRLKSQGPGYCFEVGPDEFDAARFQLIAGEGRAALARNDMAQASKSLGEALDMWRGPALTEFADEEFAREEAGRLNELRLTTHEHRLWVDLELGDYAPVVEELQKLVEEHPFRETFWEQLMLALYRAGRQAEALRAYQRVRATLAAELGIEPGPALQAMENRIVVQDPALDRALPGAPPSPPVDLPLQRTSFVGRGQELAIGADLLNRARLLTLTGPPGSGKTRLALRMAEEWGSEYQHGAFFVPLAGLTSHRQVERSIAQVLNLRETPGESILAGVKAFLKGRQVLLVLDNFEHVLPAAPQVGELLDAAPELTIMVTSRSALELSGEQEFPVPPLRVPSAKADASPDELAAYDAVALFVARARAVNPSFVLSPENAAAVAAITVRLDGLPLAIELAAARTKLLTPDDLRDRLDERLTLLMSGPTDTADRHRTIRDAIAWSYELLQPGERALFRRLGVFRGGFTLDAVSAVAALSDDEALDGVEALFTQSLLHRPVEVGRARFAMLAMISEFALEQLAEAGELEDTAAQHASYFLQLAERIEPQLSQDPGGDGSKRLAMDIDNLRAVLRYALDSGQPDLGLSLASSIWRYWQSSDLLTEGQEWLTRLLEHPAASDAARARGTSALAGLSYWLADYDETFRLYEIALDLYRSSGDQFNEADTLYSMSLTAGWKDELESAERLAQEAIALFDEIGSQEGIGRALIAQAFVVWKRKDLERAKEIWEEALAIVRASGDEALANTALVGLASLTFQLGDQAEAMNIVLEGVEAALESNAHITVWMLDFVAAFAVNTAPDQAVRLAGAVDVLRKDTGGGILPESLGVEPAKAVASKLLGPVDLEQAWAQGQLMGREEAVRQARLLGAIVSAS